MSGSFLETILLIRSRGHRCNGCGTITGCGETPGLRRLQQGVGPCHSIAVLGRMQCVAACLQLSNVGVGQKPRRGAQLAQGTGPSHDRGNLRPEPGMGLSCEAVVQSRVSMASRTGIALRA